MEDLEIIKLEPKHIEQVFQYQLEEFCPDAPLFQTFKFFEGQGYFDKLIAKDIKKLIIEEPIKAGDSFGAFDKQGNLLGIRLGKIAEQGKLPKAKCLKKATRKLSFLRANFPKKPLVNHFCPL